MHHPKAVIEYRPLTSHQINTNDTRTYIGKIQMFVSFKSNEEIRSHTLDDDLDPFAKCKILLRSAYEAQLICGVRSLPDLLRLDPDKAQHRLLPDFKTTCFHDDLNRSQDFYQSLSHSLLTILAERLLADFSFHFTELITNKVYLYCDKPTDYENYAIGQMWVQLMCDVIERLDEACVKEDVFDRIPRMKLQFTSRRTREYVAMILGKVAPKLSHQA